MNYLPRERSTPWGPMVGAGILLLGGFALYALFDDDGIQTPSNVAVATAVPRATSGLPSQALAQTSPTPAISGGEYEVVAGDSAWLIAEKLSVPADDRDAWVQELLALNNVDELALQVGQTLVLPPIGAGSGSGVTPADVAGEDEDEEEASEAGSASEEVDGEGEAAATEEDADGEGEGTTAEDDGGDGRNADDDEDLLDLDDIDLEDDDGRDSPPGMNVQVDAMNVGACATIDDQTYCYGAGGTWTCDEDGGSMRCSGPAGQSTTCSGSGDSITCEVPSGESTTCTVNGNSTVCTSNNEDVSSDSQSQNCTVLGSATLCFESDGDD